MLDDAGHESGRLRVSTPRDDYQATVAASPMWSSASSRWPSRRARGQRPGHRGLGIPGVVSPATGLVKNSNSTWIIGHPLDRDLEQRAGAAGAGGQRRQLLRAVRGGGRRRGAGRCPERARTIGGPRVVFGVIVGTGTGGGVAVDRQVLTGPNAIAGEWGHNPLPWMRAEELPGPDCYCGNAGCIETFLSGPGLARDHLRATGRRWTRPAIVAVPRPVTRRRRPPWTATRTAWPARWPRSSNVLDPDVVVLGGGLSKIERLYQNVPRLWGRYTFSDSISTTPAAAAHGDASGVRGAAWLWPLRLDPRARLDDRSPQPVEDLPGAQAAGGVPAGAALAVPPDVRTGEGAGRRQLRHRRRGAGGIPGAQRRGQDHHPEDPVGPAAPHRRARSRWAGFVPARARPRLPAAHHPGDGAKAAAAVGSAAGRRPTP